MNKLTIFFLAIAATVFGMAGSACTGFADGPAISLVSSTNRISNTWEVKEAAVNGVDITARYDADFFDFKDNGVYKQLDAAREISLPPYTQDTIVPLVGEGEWNFIDKNQIELLYQYSFQDPYNSNVRYTEELYERWEITRLTEEQLWMRNDSILLKMEFFVN